MVLNQYNEYYITLYKCCSFQNIYNIMHTAFPDFKSSTSNPVKHTAVITMKNIQHPWLSLTKHLLWVLQSQDWYFCAKIQHTKCAHILIKFPKGLEHMLVYLIPDNAICPTLCGHTVPIIHSDSTHCRVLENHWRPSKYVMDLSENGPVLWCHQLKWWRHFTLGCCEDE